MVRKRTIPPPDVTHEPNAVFAREVGRRRRRKEWTQTQLATRLAELGSPIHRTVLNRLERGSRGVSLNEAFAIAAALDVAPIYLVTPAEIERGVEVTPKHGFPGDQVRTWIRGDIPLPIPAGDQEFFVTEVAQDEGHPRRAFVDGLLRRASMLRTASARGWQRDALELIQEMRHLLDAQEQDLKLEAARRKRGKK